MRATNRVVAAVLALCVVAATVAAATEIALAGLGRRWWFASWPDWERWALKHAWADTPVRLTSAALCVAGLILVVLAFSRHRPITLEMSSGRPDVAVHVQRASTEQSMRRAAEGVDGVDRAAVRITKRRARVTARSHRRDVADLNDRVTAAVAGRLETLGLIEPLALRTRVLPRRDR